MNDKVKPEHLQRKAIVYVRQSTAEQVRFNRESQRRQYELADRARTMGWTNIQVIDEDLGLSGATSANRQGFQRLVADVCLNEVGAVFSLEASRLARNNRDWHQLVDFCSLVGTLIIDFDGIYDPRIINDRLLLGLKGTMSEFELSLIRQRSQEALRGMVQRGELLTTLPVGYVRSGDNRCEKDPDARIQHAVQLVFSKFAETGSVRQTLLWFRNERIVVPRLRNGEARGVEWKLPLYGTLHKMLLNPTYAGAYAYGRTYTRTTVENGQARKTRGHRHERQEWAVLLLDHHEAFISWEQYEHNQGRIQENAAMKGAMTRGPVRTGKSLAAGLLRCRRCGRKLHVNYSGSKGDVPRYGCRGASITHGEGKCLSFGGLAFDRALEAEVMRVLEPAAIEAAIHMSHQAYDQDEQKRQALGLELQQATYEANRARKQFDAVDPENRLVAAELEKRWNMALARVTALEAELAIEPKGQCVSPLEATSLMQLAEQFPVIWDHPQTDMRLRKRLVRTLVEEILVDVDEHQAMIHCVIHWAGGVHTELKIRKNRTGQHRYSTDKTAVELVQELAKVAADRDIATVLNRLGTTTGKGSSWTESRVRSLRVRLGVPAFSGKSVEERGWLTMAQVAETLGISPMSVRRLLQRGVLQGSQVVPFAPWVIQRSGLDEGSVRVAVQAIKTGRRVPLPAGENQLKLDLEPFS